MFLLKLRRCLLAAVLLLAQMKRDNKKANFGVVISFFYLNLLLGMKSRGEGKYILFCKTGVSRHFRGHNLEPEDPILNINIYRKNG